MAIDIGVIDPRSMALRALTAAKCADGGMMSGVGLFRSVGGDKGDEGEAAPIA